jgi:hypothetical protein
LKNRPIFVHADRGYRSAAAAALQLAAVPQLDRDASTGLGLGKCKHYSFFDDLIGWSAPSRMKLLEPIRSRVCPFQSNRVNLLQTEHVSSTVTVACGRLLGQHAAALDSQRPVRVISRPTPFSKKQNVRYAFSQVAPMGNHTHTQSNKMVADVTRLIIEARRWRTTLDLQEGQFLQPSSRAGLVDFFHEDGRFRPERWLDDLPAAPRPTCTMRKAPWPLLFSQSAAHCPRH